MLRSFFYLLLAIAPQLALSQQEFLHLNRYHHEQYDAILNNKENPFHSSVKPYRQAELDSVISSDSISGITCYNIGRNSRAGRVLSGFLNTHLISVKAKDFRLTIDPLFNFEAGADIKTKEKSFVNTRGVQLNGAIGKNFNFHSSFLENQASFVSYLDSSITETKIVPGQGEVKPFKSGSYDYSMASAYISFSPSEYFNFQFGTGKNFIGDGYRSLLLSDNSFNYPFLKITTSIWKIKYVNIFAQFQDIRPVNATVLGKGYPKKFGSFHYLSWNVSKRLNLGFFESIIWQTSDSTHYRGFDLNYLNPVIFYRAVEFSLGSADNALIGLNGKFKLSNSCYLYGQFILDDLKFSELKNKKSFYHQKFGYQAGFKANNLFRIRHLDIRTEYNAVMPYTYAHRLSRQNYGHYNAALAHPLGANFKESVSIVSYRTGRLQLETTLMYAIYGADNLGKNFGKNIYADEYNQATSPQDPENTIGQGLKTNLMNAGFTVGYVINPLTNFRVELSYFYRDLKNSEEHLQTNFISFGIRTSLSNHYYDF